MHTTQSVVNKIRECKLLLITASAKKTWECKTVIPLRIILGQHNYNTYIIVTSVKIVLFLCIKFNGET